MKLNDKQIMIIDDDQELTVLLTRVLHTVGCKVDACLGIRPALEKLKTSRPDLIFLDLAMPELDGFTFLKFRQKSKLLALIPVIVLSGEKGVSNVKKAHDLGANDFLEKPFNARLIIQVLRSIFSSQETFIYQFTPEQFPEVQSEISAAMLEQAPGKIKVESQVRFSPGKAVTFQSDDYTKSGGGPVVCRAGSQHGDIVEGFFRAVLSPSGQANADKIRFDEWLKGLSP